MNSTNSNVPDLNSIQSLFYQVIALLGVAMLVFLYINLKNNRRSKTHRTLSTQPLTNNKLSSNLQEVADLLPYAACIANKEYKIVCSNALYDQLPKDKQLEAGAYWDKQLKIDRKNTLNHNGQPFMALGKNNTNYRISIRPLKLENLSFQLYAVLFEETTELQEQLQSIEEIDPNFKRNISNAHLPVMLISNDYQVFEFNDRMLHLLQRKPQNLMGCNFLELFTEDEHEGLQQLLSNENTPAAPQNTFSVILPNKNLLAVELSHIPFKLFGVQAILCIIKDVSERKQMEREVKKARQRAEESDRLKSSFLANMSHEVRTPLNSIMGFTELMCDEQITTQERREFHSIVKNSSNELLSLLNDIMEFSKIESGLIQLRVDNIKPHDIINELREQLQKQLSKHPNLELRIEEPIGINHPPLIQSDKERTKQVLRHLLDNAIKFTYSGTITLSYHYRLDGSLEFIVSDTGIGIPEDKIPNIFHKFRQANNDNSRDFGGAGLGLSICKHLSTVLGGFLWVSSRENKGSDFHFILPPNHRDHPKFGLDNTLVYFSKTPKTLPLNLPETKVLSLFQHEALMNVPMAHNVSAIILDSPLPQGVLNRLLAIRQIRSLSIILYEKEASEIIFSPITREINQKLKGHHQLKRYINECFERRQKQKNTN